MGWLVIELFHHENGLNCCRFGFSVVISGCLPSKAQIAGPGG